MTIRGSTYGSVDVCTNVLLANNSCRSRREDTRTSCRVLCDCAGASCSSRFLFHHHLVHRLHHYLRCRASFCDRENPHLDGENLSGQPKKVVGVGAAGFESIVDPWAARLGRASSEARANGVLNRQQERRNEAESRGQSLTGRCVAIWGKKESLIEKRLWKDGLNLLWVTGCCMCMDGSWQLG